MSRIEQAVAFLALLELRRGGEVALEQAAPFAPIASVVPPRRGERNGPPAPPDHREPGRPARAHDRGAARRRRRSHCRSRSSPRPQTTTAERSRDRRCGLLGERYAEGRSGIVLEHVAGGWAFRASREAAGGVRTPVRAAVERGLSAAALETLAIVAYLGRSAAGDRAHPRCRRGLGGRRVWSSAG
jgi:hypothetical protein